MVDFGKCSNPTRIVKLEECLELLKKQGVEEVYVEVTDPDNICFSSTKDQRTYAFCYSKNIERSIPDPCVEAMTELREAVTVAVIVKEQLHNELINLEELLGSYKG